MDCGCLWDIFMKKRTKELERDVIGAVIIRCDWCSSISNMNMIKKYLIIECTLNQFETLRNYIRHLLTEKEYNWLKSIHILKYEF